MPSDGGLIALALGDIIGQPGRKALARALPSILEETGADFVMANGENASGGLGITPEIARELLALPIQVLTSGNHIWKHKEILAFLDREPRLLRPANYPPGTPGRGAGVFESRSGVPVGVLNLEGQLFMSALPCPFRTADAELEALRRQASVVLVDFHAEATSEKRSLGHHLDGRVSAVLGTHTHVPTADAEVLARGTGYQTDLGMCGPADSVIGVRTEDALARFWTKLPSPFQVAKGRVRLQGAVVRVDVSTGRCREITQRSWLVEG